MESMYDVLIVGGGAAGAVLAAALTDGFTAAFTVAANLCAAAAILALALRPGRVCQTNPTVGDPQ
jgi:cation diffusion facilitator CzcD-associated flavoprotein CzcO